MAFGKAGISQANPIIKKASVALFRTIYTQMGPQMMAYINDLKPATIKSLELSTIEV